jgi:hypothetical protein
MKTSFSHGMSAAILAAGLLFAGTAAHADEDQARAQCQAEATAAGIQDPAAVNQYVEDCLKGETSGDAGSEGQPAESEQAPAQ